jgi:hypothetical protein
MPRSKVIERYFLEHRAKLIDVAAFLDRLDRAADEDERPGTRGGVTEEDFRVAAFRRAVVILQEERPDRVRRIMEFFSDPTSEPIEAAPMQGALGAYPGEPPAPKKKTKRTPKKTAKKPAGGKVAKRGRS